jgi:hypothetical protein
VTHPPAGRGGRRDQTDRDEGIGITMLALLSAPRGRVSAARVAARAQQLDEAEAYGIIIRLPRPQAADAAPVRPLRALRLVETDR